jgi:hypothetical protein
MLFRYDTWNKVYTDMTNFSVNSSMRYHTWFTT